MQPEVDGVVCAGGGGGISIRGVLIVFSEPFISPVLALERTFPSGPRWEDFTPLIEEAR